MYYVCSSSSAPQSRFILRSVPPAPARPYSPSLSLSASSTSDPASGLSLVTAEPSSSTKSFATALTPATTTTTTTTRVAGLIEARPLSSSSPPPTSKHNHNATAVSVHSPAQATATSVKSSAPTAPGAPLIPKRPLDARARISRQPLSPPPSPPGLSSTGSLTASLSLVPPPISTLSHQLSLSSAAQRLNSSRVCSYYVTAGVSGFTGAPVLIYRTA